MLLSCKDSSADKKKEWKKEYVLVMEEPVNTYDRLSRVFPKTVEHIQVWKETAMETARQELGNILQIPDDKRTFENTVQALDHSSNKVNRTAYVFHLLGMVSPDQNLRDAGNEASTELSKFLVDLYLDPALYRAVQTYADTTSQEENLSDEARYSLVEILNDFKRNGLSLPQDQLDQIKILKKDIAQLSDDFSQNIAKDIKTIKVSRDELKGVNPDLIATFKRDGDLYILGTDYPTYFEVMERCEISSTRKALFIAFNNRAYPNNEPVLKELFEKRHKEATLLGFSNFASLDFDSSMAKTEDRVEQFLIELAERSLKKAKKELNLLKAHLPEGVELNQDGTINPWDYSFVKEAYKQKHFSIDEAKIAEYFPVHKALSGMFAIYQDFLGLTFKEVQPQWVWHEDVRLIEIYRSHDEKFLGYLFMDLYPRDNKYTHACFMPMIKSFMKHGENTPSVGVVIANFPKANGDKPALLKHSDVETFFHEFGHAMHGVLGRTELAENSGTSVKTDYVEMPSQMFEEWMLELDMLKLVSSHYQTGESLPESIIEKKIELKKFDSGYFVVRQCMLSFLSLQLGQMDKYSVDAQKLWHDLHNTYMRDLIQFSNDAHFHTSFGHLGGYASKYYSYMWSKVFALDIFAAVKSHGLSDPTIGRRVAEELLGKGGSVDPDTLLRTFLGRDPNQDAFLADLGL